MVNYIENKGYIQLCYFYYLQLPDVVSQALLWQSEFRTQLSIKMYNDIGVS